MKKRIYLLSAMVMMTLGLKAQSLTVTGVVMAQDEPDPVIGANVMIKGSTNGTITDFDGNFSIQAKAGDVLQVSFMGYKPQDVKVQNAGPLRITLVPDNVQLQEVVAIGYGVMKKSDLTGAVSSVSAEELTKTPVAGLDQALQGRVAGVTVNSNSGQPGAAAEVRIRGIGTVNNSAPLYVVDGVMVSDIAFLSPSDIESTEILKDASATAIYGSRGANGVILVTTKKGKEGIANVNFNAYWGFQNRWHKLDLMEAKEFADYVVELGGVVSEQKYYETYGFDQWLRTYRLGDVPFYPTNMKYSDINTDWQDEVFVKNAFMHNYSLAVNGAGEKYNYSISASYFAQNGTIIGSDYERLTIRANSSFKPAKWLRIGENLSFTNSTGRNAMNNNSSPGASILSAALAMAPWDPTHYPEGAKYEPRPKSKYEAHDLSGQISASSNFKNVTNPFSMVEMSHPEDKVERWVGDIFVEILPVKGLVIRSDVSMDLSNNSSKLFKEKYEFSSYDKADKNYISHSMSRYRTLMVENTITYSNEINKHSFSVMVGQTTEQYNYDNMGGAGASILNPTSNNWYLNQATEDRTNSSDAASRTRRLSVLGRAHYSYASRYMITVNFRADASSMFPENMWGYFPSTALAWRMSEESWLKQFDVIDNLKIRAGWGQIGNDKIGTDSFILKMFNSGPTFVDYPLGVTPELATGATVLTWTNSGGKWETTEQWNVGIDFSFWNGMLGGSVDLYQRDTKEMLLGVQAPAHVGNRYSATANVGTVRNQGIEISLDHRHKVGHFSYNIGGNISFVRNKLTALNGGQPVYGDVTICDEGLGLYTFWGYEYEGVWSSDEEVWNWWRNTPTNAALPFTAENMDMLQKTQPFHAGDAKFKDQNGDGKIDDLDKVDIGNPFPWLTYGLNFGADFYGVDLSLFFQGVAGNEIYNNVRVRTEGRGTEATLSTRMRDVWTAANPDGTIPNPYGNSLNFATSSRFVENGAYFRLKNVQLGYTIPQKYTKKAYIDRFRIYATVSNLFTITKYTGYDPEIGGGVDYGNYPQSRTFTFGVNVDF